MTKKGMTKKRLFGGFDEVVGGEFGEEAVDGRGADFRGDAVLLAEGVYDGWGWLGRFQDIPDGGGGWD